MMQPMLMERLRLPLAGFLLNLCMGVTSGHAQEPPSKLTFMNRYDFQISMAKLSSRDPRFDWIGRVGGDIDLVDYVKGRTSLFAEYEVVMGNELRPFDPNQGNYTFDGSTSWRLGKTELAAVFHHLSRHLSDRPKTQAVAMNSVEGMIRRRFEYAQTTFDARAGAGKVVERAFLDYTWRAYGDLAVRHRITQSAGWFGKTKVEALGVDLAIAGRNHSQSGGRIETGLRLEGSRGAVELFGGWEHMADAYPLERLGKSWAFIGFRLGSR
jgi:hypothetical protein